MNQNELILQSLIDSGHLTRLDADMLMTKVKGMSDVYECDFENPITTDAFVIIQQALFDACAEHHYMVSIHRNALRVFIPRDLIRMNEFEIYKGNTTRESWVAAYKKVMGIEA